MSKALKTMKVGTPAGQLVDRIVFDPAPGTPVHWFRKADPGEPPVPAMVLRVVSDRADLLVFDGEDGLRQYNRVCVPHLSDPYIVTNRKLFLDDSIGGWDFHPDFVPMRFRGIDAMRHRMVLLAQLHNYDARQIAAALGTNFSEQDVLEVLERHAAGAKA